MTSENRKRVMVAMTWSTPGQELGMVQYARKAGWILRVVGPTDHQEIAAWGPSGLICQLHQDSAELVQAVGNARIPTVELNYYIPSMKTPRVMVDMEAMGHAAADHFLERNYRRLVHVSFASKARSPRYSARGFREHAAAKGITAETIYLDLPDFWVEQGIGVSGGITHDVRTQAAETLIRWITSRNEPTGLFCDSTRFALDIVDCATELGVHVPEQIAMLIESLPPHENELGSVPLSFISWDFNEQGYLAAETLDLMFKGETVPDIQWIAPLPVKVNESSDAMAANHLPAAMALKYFRQHALEYNFNLEKAAETLNVSLSTLHRWFKEYIGMTPAQMIEDRRVKHALSLMSSSHISLEAAARQSGFSEARQLRRALKRRFDIKTLRNRAFNPLEIQNHVGNGRDKTGDRRDTKTDVQ